VFLKSMCLFPKVLCKSVFFKSLKSFKQNPKVLRKSLQSFEIHFEREHTNITKNLYNTQKD